MEVQKKFSRALKQVRQSQISYIEFFDFFPSEKVFNFFGLENFPSSIAGKIKRWNLIVQKVSFLSVLMFFAFAVISAINAISKDDTMLILAENGCVISVVSLIFAKIYYIAFVHHEKILGIIATLDRYYPQNVWNQQVFQVSKELEQLKIMEIILVIMVLFGDLLFTFMPFYVYAYGYFTSKNLELDSVLQLDLPLDMKFPINYFVINLASIIGIISGSIFVLMTDLLYMELVALASMELNILGCLISEIDPKNNNREALIELKKLIVVHKELIAVTEDLEAIFSPILFFDIFGIMGLMIFSAFLTFSGISATYFIKYIFMFGGATYNAFTHCYYGDRLKESSLSIADGAYNSNWIDGDVKFHKLILIIIHRAQKQQELTGMNFFVTDLKTFDWIRNATYSYYTFLSGVYKS